MLEQAQLTKLRNKLDLNETLVWAGKPRPHWFCKTTPFFFLFGTFWCSFVSIFVIGMLIPMWFGDGSGQVTVNDVKTTYGQMSLLSKLGLTAFFLPFIAIGIGVLFHPLWIRIHSSGLIYAVTNKRALVKGRLITTSWRASEITTPDRADKRSGVSHIYFTTSYNNGHFSPNGFTHLPSRDATAAEAALHQLKAD